MSCLRPLLAERAAGQLAPTVGQMERERRNAPAAKQAAMGVLGARHRHTEASLGGQRTEARLGA